MNRRTRTLVVVGVAVLLASVASFGVFQTIKNLPVEKVPIAGRATVVATRTVPVGVLITPEMVRVTQWPADAPVAGAFGSVNDVVGRGVTAAFVANEPVVESKLASKQSGGGLAPTITPGMRAVSVRINDVIGVSGFTIRGTRVDVIVTLRGQESMSRTVISNVEVLAAGLNLDEKPRDGRPVPSVATLLLTPSDVERLALAAEQGQITLALRNPLDQEKTETTGVRLSGLMGALGPAEPVRPAARVQPRTPAPLPPPPPPAPKGVVGIRGTKVTQEVVKGGGGGE